MSLSLIGLFINWVLELDFKLKWENIKNYKYLPIIFLGIFLIELIWLPISRDLITGLNVLRIKLPLLLLPIIIGTTKQFSKKENKTLIITFFLGIIVSTFLVFLVDLGWLNTKKDSGTIRDISIFMSHIRYSILLSFATILILFLVINKKKNRIRSFNNFEKFYERKLYHFISPRNSSSKVLICFASEIEILDSTICFKIRGIFS